MQNIAARRHPAAPKHYTVSPTEQHFSMAICCCIWSRKSRGRNQGGPSNNPRECKNPTAHQLLRAQLPSSHLVGLRKFTLDELTLATQNFSDSQKLGVGGFGSVFRGTVTPEEGMRTTNREQMVAVKRISKDVKGGFRGFQAELSIISNVRHRTLVELRGWGENENWLFLIYEYMANGSLDTLLHDDRRYEELCWKRRFKVLKDLASALKYLHEDWTLNDVVLHRDIKSSNVLLDENFNAKLGDFGLSRQVEVGLPEYDTTEVAGTMGYMAPEYYLTSRATKKSDVFSFGAVLAEVACGKKPLLINDSEAGDGLLLDWLWDLHSKHELETGADKRLNESYKRFEMRRVLVLALACGHPDPKERPSMSKALSVLEGITPLPSLPRVKPLVYYTPTPGPPPVGSISSVCVTAERYFDNRHSERRSDIGMQHAPGPAQISPLDENGSPSMTSYYSPLLPVFSPAAGEPSDDAKAYNSGSPYAATPHKTPSSVYGTPVYSPINPYATSYKTPSYSPINPSSRISSQSLYGTPSYSPVWR